MVRQRRRDNTGLDLALPWVGEVLQAFYDELAWRHGQARRIQRAENGSTSLLA